LSSPLYASLLHASGHRLSATIATAHVRAIVVFVCIASAHEWSPSKCNHCPPIATTCTVTVASLGCHLYGGLYLRRVAVCATIDFGGLCPCVAVTRGGSYLLVVASTRLLPTRLAQCFAGVIASVPP
ncbi:hypothetical protein BHM03_00005773, partial [Ensete ventricosum]